MKIKELKEKDLLYKNIQWWIDRIRKKKSMYVILYRASRILTFIAGGTITVLIGWQKVDKNELELKNVILCISSFVTLLAALEGLLDLKDKAKRYDVFLYDLRKLRDQMSFDYDRDPKVYEENKNEYFRKYEAILEAKKMIIENSYDSEE